MSSYGGPIVVLGEVVMFGVIVGVVLGVAAMLQPLAAALAAIPLWLVLVGLAPLAVMALLSFVRNAQRLTREFEAWEQESLDVLGEDFEAWQPAALPAPSGEGDPWIRYCDECGNKLLAGHCPLCAR